MRRDFGSRDGKFIDLIRSVRQGILDVEKLDSKEFTSILMQGSGTFAVESAITTSIPRNAGKLLVLSNGSYGDRAGAIAKYQGIDVEVIRYPENSKPDPVDVDKTLNEHKTRGKPFSTVFVVHSETTSGIINPIHEIGKVVKHKHNLPFIVDAMSSFGGLPIDFNACGIDFLVTSANKCLQGVPGFGIIVARQNVLQKCKGNARSLSLDCYDQWQGLENNGQFRFTPPTHTICAFQQALDELTAEGGVKKRMERYKKKSKNCDGCNPKTWF
jgi:2-aminoethylphosphonate-pyruvate transaminase